MSKCNSDENPACCCDSAEVGTIIDNSDCVSNFKQTFATEQEAQLKLEKLTADANQIASEPCEINSSIEKQADGYELKASFSFCCGTENLIYQFKLR